MSNKSTTDLYVNVHGLSKLKNLNKELRNTADLLLGITEYAKYLKEAGADKQDIKLFVNNLVSNLTRETEVAPSISCKRGSNLDRTDLLNLQHKSP